MTQPSQEGAPPADSPVSARAGWGLVLALLRLTLARTWWLFLGALLLTVGVLQLPQGREFFDAGASLGQALALLLSGALISLLMGSIAVWLVAPHSELDPKPPPVAGWFAAGLVGLLIGGVAASAQQFLVPDAFAPRWVLFPAVLAAWFTAHFGVWRDAHVLRWTSTAAIWSCWIAMFSTLLLPNADWATLCAALLLLAAHSLIARHLTNAYQVPADQAASPLSRAHYVIAPLTSGLVITVGYRNAVDPVWSLGNQVGPVATLAIALAFWVAVAFLLVWAAAALTLALRRFAGNRHPTLRWQGVGTTFLVLATAWLLHSLATGQMASAPVRQISAARQPAQPAAAVEAAETTEAWILRRLERMAKQSPDRNSPLPVVIVAAEGGGIRAAYWTASILAALHERYEHFDQSLLALSGVSGGSVGVTVYQAVANGRLMMSDCRRRDCPETLRVGVQQILGDDFLSPTLMAMLVGEPLRDLGLAPHALDRAAALETSLEASFHRVAGEPSLGDGMCQLQQEADTLLLPGLTDARTGQRIVLACQRRESTSTDITLPVWLPAGQQLAASTAAFLSARFPLVSPTGVLTHQDQTYRIVDGGFSDNSSTGTAVDALLMLHDVARTLGLSQRLRPIVLVISNSPPLAAGEAQPGAFGRGVLSLLGDPLATLDAVRARNSRDYRRWLDSVAKDSDHPATIIEWRLPQTPAGGYPLGWLLSRQTRDSIAGDVSMSMLGSQARALEAVTGWSLHACEDQGLEDYELDACRRDQREGRR